MITKKNIVPFIQTQKQKQLLMNVLLMMYLNKSIVGSNIKNSLGKGSGWIKIIIFQSTIP